jgi:1-deoxy-D-xylulose-5-phosphate reductoisomerase
MPIAAGLTWPARIAGQTKRIDLAALGRLSFERPDGARFRALPLARQAMEAGGMAPCVLNAANEVSVAAFLEGRIGFLGIADLVADAMEAAATRGLLGEAQDAGAVLAADAATRDLTLTLLKKHARA